MLLSLTSMNLAAELDPKILISKRASNSTKPPDSCLGGNISSSIFARITKLAFQSIRELDNLKQHSHQLICIAAVQ